MQRLCLVCSYGFGVAWSRECERIEAVSYTHLDVYKRQVLYTVRDDSVPWVRRLAAILRNFDPSAMSGSPEVAAVAALSSSPHFSRVEHRAFRRWVPITRDGMLEMVSNAPNLVNLPDPDASRLLAGVEALYESSARNPEPLLLPYSVLCWRARVDHSELSGLLRLPAEGLQITL